MASPPVDICPQCAQQVIAGSRYPWKGNISALELRGLVLGVFCLQGQFPFPSLSCECLICKMGLQLLHQPPGLLVEQWVHSLEGPSDYEADNHVSTVVLLSCGTRMAPTHPRPCSGDPGISALPGEGI